MKTFNSCKILAILILFLFSKNLFSQITTVNTYKNVITAKESIADLQGNPYLIPNWEAANIKFGEGIPAKIENIKYDLIEDLVVIKGEGDIEYTFTETPIEFEIQRTKEVYRNGFAAVDKMTEKTFYNVVYDGKVKFLKKLSKMIMETRVYNSASIVKKVVEENNYYLVLKNNNAIKIKNNEKSIVATLGKSDELSKYIKLNKIEIKSKEDIIKLLTYYDSL